MTGHDAFDRRLADWFEADARSSAPATGLDKVIDATRHRRPRPAWLSGPGSHWVGDAQESGSSSGARGVRRLGQHWTMVLILVLVIAALVSAAILVGARLSLPTSRSGHLAYGLDGDIFVADWDGRNPIRIADGLPSNTPPDCQGFWGEGSMWSPDGRHLAYRRGGALGTCTGTVYLSDPMGHVVASFPGEGWLVSWSPDSTRVATWVSLGKTIGIYGLDGVRQALLTVPVGCTLPGDFDPLWSPDGRSVVVWPCEVPIDGHPPARLPASDPRSNGRWMYSPDGTRVAYTTADTTAEWLVLAAADGSHARVLIPTDVILGPVPVWSPSGDRIAFDAGPVAPAANEIRVVDTTSGAVTSLVSAAGTDSLHVIAFATAGDRVLYASLDANYAPTALWSVNADGTHAQLLVTGTGWGDWQVSPAGP